MILSTFLLVSLFLIENASAECVRTCYNGGTLEPKTNTCKCSLGYQGQYCQYSVDPCSVEDNSECSNVDCWNATEIEFYGCQRKCLCCVNKKCYNQGVLETKGAEKCSCSCITNIYNPSDDCKSITKCEDIAQCWTQFGGRNNCGSVVVQALCPKMCGRCTSSI
jgi:hypothetical protein